MGDTAAIGHRDLAQAAGVAWDTWRRDLARTGRYLMGCTPNTADAIRAGGRIPGLVLCAWWLAARAEKARAAA